MAMNSTDDILKAILTELKAIELQVVISRHKDDMYRILDGTNSKAFDEDTLNDVVDRLRFIAESDKNMFDKRYNVWKAAKKIKEMEKKENDMVSNDINNSTNSDN